MHQTDGPSGFYDVATAPWYLECTANVKAREKYLEGSLEVAGNRRDKSETPKNDVPLKKREKLGVQPNLCRPSLSNPVPHVQSKEMGINENTVVSPTDVLAPFSGSELRSFILEFCVEDVFWSHDLKIELQCPVATGIHCGKKCVVRRRGEKVYPKLVLLGNGMAKLIGRHLHCSTHNSWFHSKQCVLDDHNRIIIMFKSADFLCSLGAAIGMKSVFNNQVNFSEVYFFLVSNLLCKLSDTLVLHNKLHWLGFLGGNVLVEDVIQSLLPSLDSVRRFCLQFDRDISKCVRANRWKQNLQGCLDQYESVVKLGVMVDGTFSAGAGIRMEKNYSGKAVVLTFGNDKGPYLGEPRFAPSENQLEVTKGLEKILCQALDILADIGGFESIPGRFSVKVIRTLVCTDDAIKHKYLPKALLLRKELSTRIKKYGVELDTAMVSDIWHEAQHFKALPGKHGDTAFAKWEVRGILQNCVSGSIFFDDPKVSFQEFFEKKFHVFLKHRSQILREFENLLRILTEIHDLSHVYAAVLEKFQFSPVVFSLIQNCLKNLGHFSTFFLGQVLFRNIPMEFRTKFFVIQCVSNSGARIEIPSPAMCIPPQTFKVISSIVKVSVSHICFQNPDHFYCMSRSLQHLLSSPLNLHEKTGLMSFPIANDLWRKLHDPERVKALMLGRELGKAKGTFCVNEPLHSGYERKNLRKNPDSFDTRVTN